MSKDSPAGDSSTSDEQEAIFLKEILESDPWLLPKEVIHPNGSKTNSINYLTDLGFEVTTAVNQPLGRLFYVETARPDGWSKDLERFSQLIRIYDDAGKLRLLLSYAYVENYARLVVPCHNRPRGLTVLGNNAVLE